MAQTSTDASDPRLQGFDPDWYAATYPDVGISGLDPTRHYLLCGVHMNRAKNAYDMASNASVLAPEQPQDVAARFGHESGTPVLEHPQSGDKAIIAAPRDIPAIRRRSVQAPVRKAMPGLAALVWGDLELGSGDAAEVLTQTAGPVLSLHAMLQTGDAEGASALHLRTPDGFQKPLTMPVGLPDTAQIASPLFLEGPAKITDAWFATTATLRVALQGHDGVQGMPDAAGTLRGWQPDPGTPGALIALNESPLPEVGPGFVDLILDNPLMPVLLELADSNGTTRGFGLLPYPSLLRGGLHDAERAAAQMSLMPLDDVWRLSLALMREHTTGVAQNRFSIARLAVRLADATGAETVFGPHVREWLSILFGLDLHVAEDAQGALGDDHGTAWLRESLTSDRPDRGNGMVLTLPAQGIPSLQALVSTRMHMPADQNIAAGPWLVSDAVHAKPLWSVVMPADAPVSADMPVLSQGAETPETQGASSQAQSQTQSQAHWLAPLHLAVILRPRDIPNDTVSLFPVAPDAQVAVPDAAQELDLCVVVTVGDPGEAEAALIALKTQAGLKPFNLVLRLRNGASADSMQPITAKAQNLFEITPKVMTPQTGMLDDLDALLEATTSEHIALLDAAVILHHEHILATLTAELAANATTASVGCSLFHTHLKGNKPALAFVSGGIFPGGVSLLSAPHLTVVEPDTRQALPASRYPVLANTFDLCVIRRAALSDTAPARATMPGTGATDLHFGLSGLAAGWRHICTSQISAGMTQPPARRDEIDPFGMACILPARWDDLLAQVTVIRELRG